MVARHENLRTTIKATDGVPLAIVRDTHSLRLKTIDLSGLTVAQREREVEHLLLSEPSGPFHIQKEPGFRATLVRLGPHEHVFILIMHHLIWDGLSQGILWRDLSSFYRGYCCNESVVLPPLPIQYGDFALWQRQHLKDANLTEDLRFWAKYFAGAPGLLQIPSDRPRPKEISYRGARRRLLLHRTLTDALRRFARQEGKDLFILFRAAFAILLHRYTGQEDILLGFPVPERGRPELRFVIGFLVHTCALRSVLSGNTTFREIADQVQKDTLLAYRHRAVLFDEIVPRSAART